MMGNMLKGKNDVITLRINGGGPIGNLTAVADSNGDVRVTEELRWFLQAFTIGQAYFYDGNGVVENFKEAEGYNVYALESNQWTFICGYYV